MRRSFAALPRLGFFAAKQHTRAARLLSLPVFHQIPGFGNLSHPWKPFVGASLQGRNVAEVGFGNALKIQRVIVKHHFPALRRSIPAVVVRETGQMGDDGCPIGRPLAFQKLTFQSLQRAQVGRGYWAGLPPPALVLRPQKPLR